MQFVQANVSAARADLTTFLRWFDFHSIGQHFLFLSARNIIYPLWLPPFFKLLQLASAKLLIYPQSRSNPENVTNDSYNLLYYLVDLNNITYSSSL